jgi:hypothetical protein
MTSERLALTCCADTFAAAAMLASTATRTPASATKAVAFETKRRSEPTTSLAPARVTVKDGVDVCVGVNVDVARVNVDVVPVNVKLDLVRLEVKVFVVLEVVDETSVVVVRVVVELPDAVVGVIVELSV